MHQVAANIHFLTSHMFHDDMWIFKTPYYHIVTVHLPGDVENNLIYKIHTVEVLIVLMYLLQHLSRRKSTTGVVIWL